MYNESCSIVLMKSIFKFKIEMSMSRVSEILTLLGIWPLRIFEIKKWEESASHHSFALRSCAQKWLKMMPEKPGEAQKHQKSEILWPPEKRNIPKASAQKY